MLYMVKLPDGTIMRNTLFKTKASLPLEIDYEYFELDPISMEVFPIRIRDLRTNHEKTRKMLEENLAQWERTKPEPRRTQESIDVNIQNVKKLIEIFS